MPKKFKPQKSSVKNDGKKTAINIFLYGILPILIIFLIIFLVLLIYFPIFLKPNHKIIQYQEEVKLSDGSMIWVDIKRHYRLTGGAPGDAGMFEGAYLPSIVEISWDTGFEGVGRKTLSFAHLSAIDKIENVWYIVGNVYECPLDGSLGIGVDTKRGIQINGQCVEQMGSWIDKMTDRGWLKVYVFAINSNGIFDRKLSENLPIVVNYNILGFFMMKS